MVRPATRTGPQGMRPRAPRRSPQIKVAQRERWRRPAWDEAELESGMEAAGPRNLLKSTMLEEARELSEPLALDMATARMAASTKPERPTGMYWTMNSGKMRSGSAVIAGDTAACW